MVESEELDPGIIEYGPSPSEPNRGSTFDHNYLILLIISFNQHRAIGRCIPR